MNPIHEAWKATLRALRPSPPTRAETLGPHAACAGQARTRVTLVSRWKARLK